MASDIDIEEHNLFENPELRVLFPDITALKQEIYNEDIEVTDIPYDQTTQKRECQLELDHSQHFDENKQRAGKKNHALQPKTCILKNKIVIGSKPKSSKTTDFSMKHNITKQVAMPKVGREFETLKNKISVRRPPKTSTERSRESRERKKALKIAAGQTAAIKLKTKPKTPAERSRDYRARKRARKNADNDESNDSKLITIKIEVDQEQDDYQPSIFISPMRKVKTSTERCREFRARKKSLMNPTEDIEDFQTSHVINDNYNNDDDNHNNIDDENHNINSRNNTRHIQDDLRQSCLEKSDTAVPSFSKSNSDHFHPITSLWIEVPAYNETEEGSSLTS